jgi:membrane dipeptidase
MKQSVHLTWIGLYQTIISMLSRKQFFRTTGQIEAPVRPGRHNTGFAVEYSDRVRYKSSMKCRLPVIFLFASLATPAAWPSDADLAASAAAVAQGSMIVDTHIDVPYRLQEGWVDVTRGTDEGDFDYDRARLGGLNLPFMSIYTPAELEAEGGSFELANQLIDNVEALVGRTPEKFVLVTSTGEAEQARKQGLIGLAMGMENGSPIEGDLENLQFFFDRGIRYITLTHSLGNHISDSSFDEERQWSGLSPFGREVVREMNRQGIMVDISHVSDEAFYQVLEITKAPVIASHSSARHFTPGWERNMSDEMIRALAENGGVIQINFGSPFVTDEAHQWFEAMKKKRSAYLEENGFDEHGDEADKFQEAYREEHPFPYAKLSDLADHFDHVVGLVGIEHLGIGSDFDGVGDSLPEGIKDVSFYPALIEELMKREYTVENIQAILGGNLMRVWRAVEDHAKARAESPGA